MPLKLIVFPQSGLAISASELRQTLDNLNGLKVIAGSKIASEIVQKLGGAPLSFRIDEYYETLQRGTADGVLVGWTAFNPFKLAEVTHYLLDVPLGGETGYIFMARKEWNTLPAPVQKILADNSGEGVSRDFGKFWDEVVKEGKDDTYKLPGHTLLHPLTAACRRRAGDDTIAADRAGSGRNPLPDGEKILSTYVDLLAKVKAGS